MGQKATKSLALVDTTASTAALMPMPEPPLFEAAEKGDEESVQKYLTKGVKLDEIDKYGRTVLHVAAERGHLRIVQLLLASGANPNAVDDDAQTPLIYAARNGHADIAQVLITTGVDTNYQTRLDLSALHFAAMKGHTETIKVLLAAGAIDLIDKAGLPPLLYAAKDNHIRSVMALLSPAADDYAISVQFAYQIAHLNQYADLAAILKAFGAKPEVEDYSLVGSRLNFAAAFRKDKKNETALADAKRVVQSWLNGDDDINALQTGSYGHYAPLHIAALYGNSEMILALIALGADIDRKNIGHYSEIHHKTSLYLAAEYGHKEAVELLLSKGAKVDVKDNYGQTALYKAVKNIDVDIVALLLSGGANVDETDENSRIALHLAAEYGRTEITRLLLAAGADINAKNKDGKTAADIAKEERHIICLTLLLAHGTTMSMPLSRDIGSAAIAAIPDATLNRRKHAMLMYQKDRRVGMKYLPSAAEPS